MTFWVNVTDTQVKIHPGCHADVQDRHGPFKYQVGSHNGSRSVGAEADKGLWRPTAL